MLPQKRTFASISPMDNEDLDVGLLEENRFCLPGVPSLLASGHPETIGCGPHWNPESHPIQLDTTYDFGNSITDSSFSQIILPVSDSEIAQYSDWDRICFGTLHGVRAKLWIDTGRLQDILGGLFEDEGGTHGFQIRAQRNYFVVSTQHSEQVAVFNERTSNVLRLIWNLESISFQVLATPETSDSSTTMGSNKTPTPKDGYMNFSINLYGERRIKDMVGSTLSSAQMFLQHPLSMEYGSEYDNPHFVSIPNVQPNLTESSSSTTQERNEAHAKSIADDTQEYQFQNELAVVFNSLTRSRCLKMLDADMRIKTPLLPHQKEALDFMAQREFGPVPPQFSLWRGKYSDSWNETCFEHAITGSKSQLADSETGCGISADDMGLGKTLSCLATVVRTAQIATQFWEAGRTLQEKEGGGVQPRRYAARATLVIVPSQVLITGWTQEIHKHVYGGLQLRIYHGRGRERDPEILAKADIVFTTYHTISTEGLKSDSPLFQITWFRIVLDEAHYIRSKSTSLYQMASRLDSRLRWCLTGTPVQNKLEDIGSLISFLRVPFLDTAPAFKKHVIDPLMKATGAGSANLRILLDSICLRRSKSLLDLPHIDVEDRVLNFTDNERKQYKTSELEMSKAIKQQANLENPKKGFFGIFQMEMRLRRLCNHGTYQKPFLTSLDDLQGTPRSGLSTPQPKQDAQCDFCGCSISSEMLGDDPFSSHFTVCGHFLCSKCVPDFEHKLAISKDETGLQCPLCHTRLTGDYFQSDSITQADYFNEEGESTKILALIGDIERNVTKGKGIIFSGWTKSLDLIAQLLQPRRILFERIDGSCSVSERNRVLDTFRKKSAAQILMMTTGTGAVGLNLAVANFVYILEPQWNPMVESQAIARVSRLGQKKNVSVIRYIMKGTVEETMRSQQIRKLALADVGWGEDGPGAI